MTTLRSVIAHLASMIRCAGIAYIIVQVVIWHSYYTSASWRLAAPGLAAAWAVTVTAYLRTRWPSHLLACADSAVYLALALGAQECVPPPVRDSALSWLVIAMSGQLIVPAWYAPGLLCALLTLSSPLAYWTGAVLLPVTNAKTLTGAGILLLVVGLVHGCGRRVLYHQASVADAEVARADLAAREQYAVLCRNIERREHERLLHDTVLNALTALVMADGTAGAEMVTRCQQDVTRIEAALGGADDPHADATRASSDLLGEVRAIATDMRARGLTVHLEDEAAETVPAETVPAETASPDTVAASGEAVPAQVISAISNAVREALSNVAEHAGTGEAWVSVRRTAPEGNAEAPCRLEVVVRDKGAGFDLAHIDRARLGLKQSITGRTVECGGQASIWSAPRQGTVVSLSWPAPEPAGQDLAGQSLVPVTLPW